MIKNTDSTKSSSLSTKTIVFIVLSVILLNILIIVACKYYMQRKVKLRMESDSLNDKISSAVSNYMMLKDKN